MSNEAEGYFTRFNPNTVRWLGNAREVLGEQPEPVVEDEKASPGMDSSSPQKTETNAVTKCCAKNNSHHSSCIGN